MSAVVNILRFAVAFIDSIVVWLIKMIYGLFFQLTDIMLYSEDIVQGLGQRIGLILGIFMLFRLAVSLVTYLISPDKLNDNAKGGGKMLVNIIISLVLLATVNIIFVQAYKIQDVVIRSKFIEKIFFGSKAEVADTDISYYLYTPLFSPNEEAFNNLCADLWDPTTKIEDDEACDSKLYEILGDDRRAVYQAFNSQDMSIVLGNYNVVTAKSNGVYAFDYKYISPIAGIVCAIVLISFSMDLAVRAVKLLFLQIISPIPIISNIDPGKGQDMFKKWYQECFKTYISVFIRMITIDFAVFLITILLTNFKELFTSEPLLNVALIVGALIFAKQVPKLIEDMFGIKLDGMALHPLKKFQEQSLLNTELGKVVSGVGRGVAAGAIGGVAGAVGGVGASIGLHQNLFKGFGAGVGGALRGIGGGISGGYKSKNMLEALGKGKGQATVQGGRVVSLDGTTLGGRMKASAQQFFKLPTDYDTSGKQLTALKDFSSSYDAIASRGKAESIKHNELSLEDGKTMAQHKLDEARLQRLKNEGVNRDDFYSEQSVFDQSKYDNDEEVQNARRYGLTLPDMNDDRFKSVQRVFDRAAYDTARVRHDQIVSDLETQINIENVKFGEAYADAVARGEYSDDVEMIELINKNKSARDELVKYYGEQETDARFGINGDDGIFKASTAKRSKSIAEADISSINISTEFKTQKANAEATKKQ